MRIAVTCGLAACLAAAVLFTACGGGGGDDSTPGTGSLQVLNNTGVDLANVQLENADGTMVAEIGGGLAQGATFLFANLAPGSYDVLGFPGGGGVQQILFYTDNVVQAWQITNVTMVP